MDEQQAQIEDETKETFGHEVVVEGTYAAPVGAVWDALISPEGQQILLGNGATLGDKGDDWRSEEGHEGVVRSFHPQQQVRFSWKAAAGDPATLVEVNLTGEGSDATHIEIKQSKVPEAGDLVALRELWEKVVDRLADLVAKRG